MTMTTRSCLVVSRVLDACLPWEVCCLISLLTMLLRQCLWHSKHFLLSSSSNRPLAFYSSSILSYVCVNAFAIFFAEPWVCRLLSCLTLFAFPFEFHLLFTSCVCLRFGSRRRLLTSSMFFSILSSICSMFVLVTWVLCFAFERRGTHATLLPLCWSSKESSMTENIISIDSTLCVFSVSKVKSFQSRKSFDVKRPFLESWHSHEC